MSDLVPTDQIEALVGAPRHETQHLARAVSSEQTVYVLHSRQCLTDSRRFGRDLRDCPFSLALDNGIDTDEWVEHEDDAVAVVVEAEQLVPRP